VTGDEGELPGDVPDWYDDSPDDDEARPDPSADYHVEPAERRRIRLLFLEEIRQCVPDVLTFLRDRIHARSHAPTSKPRRGYRVLGPPHDQWARLFHLLGADPDLSVEEASKWIVEAGRRTCRYWDEHPEAKDPPTWSPCAADEELGEPRQYDPEWRSDLQEVRERLRCPFRFECAAWDPLSTRRADYVRLTKQMFDDKLREELDHVESVLRAFRNRDAPAQRDNDHHYRWLAQYQCGGLSHTKIAEDHQRRTGDEVVRYGVSLGVKRAAQLLIGPYWESWLRPHGRSGAPRSGRTRRPK
jgi:hypothetical protein